MEFAFDFSATNVDLAGLEPGQYVRFDSRSHGMVVMVALKARVRQTEGLAPHQFLITGNGMTAIDCVPAEIRLGQRVSIADGQVTIEVTGMIHVDC